MCYSVSMRKMSKKTNDKIKKITYYLLIASIVGATVGEGMPVTVVHATTVNALQNQINAHKNELQNIYNQIAAMEGNYDILQEEIDDLNAEILNTMTEIGLKEDEITAKEAEISVKESEIAVKEQEILIKEIQIGATRRKYEEAKAQEDFQLESMKASTRLMYENGTTSHLQALLQGLGLSELLNRLDFVERIYSYEKDRLVEYIAAKDAATALENQLNEEKAALEEIKVSLETDKLSLEEDKSSLEEDRADLEVQKANLDSLLETKKAQSDNYEAEIAKAQQKANEAKKQIQEEEKKLQTLQAQQAAQNAANGTYVTSYNAVIDAADGSELGKQVARFACQYIGNKYVYGGNSLTNGIDCSGFTQKVYAQFGYSLSRTSYSQRSEGKEVSYDDIEPGDIICYPGHVAIYIGGGLIVHASNSKPYPQGGIKVSPALYRDYVTIRRIVD